MRAALHTWALRLTACGLVLLAVQLVACGGDDDGAAGSTDGGAEQDGATGSEPDAGAGSCSERCAPEESLDEQDCRCTSDGVRMLLRPLSEGFYAQPWPLSSRLKDDGSLDLAGFPTPATASFINTNLPTVESGTHGFSTTGAIFVAFDGTIDPGTLPTPEESLADDASVYLVELSGHSGSFGERVPIECYFAAEPTGYLPGNVLACAPFPGFPLKPATTYVLVLTDALHDADGAPLRKSQRLRDVLLGNDEGDDGLTAKLIEVYAPLADALMAEGEGVEHVVGGTIYTTQNPTAELRALAEHVQAQDAPAATSLEPYAGTLPADESGNYQALEGTYDTPIYQQGTTPYQLAGGDIQFAADGTPKQNGTLPLRFALTIPEGEMPADGWPVVLYHHGTGGDAYTFITNGTAYHLAAAGVAAIGIDAPVHGTRNPGNGDPQLLFFNITNIRALRDNIRQGAVDLLALERFVAAFEQDASGSPTGEAIRFDAARIFAMGHSQGSLTLPLMLPFAEHVSGAMLSGAGASITLTILYKTEPVDIPALARTFLALGPGEELDVFHPVLALVAGYADVSDGGNYAPYLYRWEGGRGVDVWATQGLLDTFTPKQATDALVTAIGLQPVGEISEQVRGLDLRGLSATAAPVSENVEDVTGAKHTAVYSQYPDGDHFLVENDPGAQAQLEHWFESLAQDGHGELIAP